MQNTEPPVVERSLALYRRLLRAYPPEFREQYGDEMARAFRDAARAAWRGGGIAGLVGLWGRTVADTVVNAIRERGNVSREGSAMGRKEDVASRAIVSCLQLVALSALLVGAWAVTATLLPVLLPTYRGWVLLIAASIIGVLAGNVDRRPNRPVAWYRSIVWIGVFGWVLWLTGRALIGLSGPWTMRLPIMAVFSTFFTFEKDSSMEGETGLMGWKRLLLIAVLALVQLLLSPAPYLATNIFLGFVAVINGAAALLFPIALMTRNSDADTN